MILESSSTVKHTTILQNALSSFPCLFSSMPDHSSLVSGLKYLQSLV
jgi:hypothetical protein